MSQTTTLRMAARRRRILLPVLLGVALLTGMGNLSVIASAQGADRVVTTSARTTVGLYESDAPNGESRAHVVHRKHATRVGVRFRAKVAGDVTGLRVYQPFVRRSSSPLTAELWSRSGRLLARREFTPSAAKGWKSINFAASRPIKSGRMYTAVVTAPTGRFAASGQRVLTDRESNEYLRVPSELSGIVQRGTAQRYPDRSARRNRAFWVDVRFRPAPDDSSGSSYDGKADSSVQDCADDPSSCGYPDVDTAGPDSLAGLTEVPESKTSGPGWSWNKTYKTVFVSGKNAVLDGLDIHGAVVIDAPNVTLSNSRIASCGGKDDSDVVAIRYRAGSEYQGANATIVANRIIGTPSGCARRARSGVRDVYGEAPGVLVKDNNISGTGNGITIENEGLIEDNWIHDLGHLAGDHHSGISTHGGATDVVVRHNTVLLHGQRFAGGGGVSGALTIYADFGHAQNVTLQDNLISGGSYVVYGGESGDSYSRTATNIKILDNRFVCNDWLYGPIAAFDKNGRGNELSGNYCDQNGRTVR